MFGCDGTGPGPRAVAPLDSLCQCVGATDTNLERLDAAMDLLRTPDERFADLPDFPFAPHYVEVADPTDAAQTIL